MGLCMGLYAENGATLWVENKNKLVEWKALVDTTGVESGFSNFPSVGERPQTATFGRGVTAHLRRYMFQWSLLHIDHDISYLIFV